MNEYFWFVDNINKYELKECNVGDYLTIWLPESNAFINLYRPGTYSGLGKLGNITGKLQRLLIRHQKRGDLMEAEIIEIKNGICRIKCIITPIEKLIEEKNNNISKIKEELQKPFKPKSPSHYDLFTKENFELEIGDSLKLKLDNLDELESNIERIEIPIFKNNIRIGIISGQTVCGKVLRAIYSGYEVYPVIESIESQEKNLRIIKIAISFMKGSTGA